MSDDPDEYLSSIYDSDPPPSPEEPEEPPAPTWNPDDVVGAITQWVKEGYVWEDIENRVEDMFRNPRPAKGSRPGATH